jgi:hypothetical protein
MRNANSGQMVNGASLALIGVIVLAAPGIAHAQKGRPAGPDVRVVNTPSEPVPVALGAPVAIDTSSPLPVVVGGPVTIDTTTPIPVAVVETGAGPQPIQITLFQPSQNNPGINRFRVPAGKRLVIEDVSCDAVDADDLLIGIAVRTRVGAVESSHLCTFTVRVNVGRPGTAMALAGARAMRAYADPGTDVVASVAVTPAAAFPIFSAVLSGYLVDVP